jgi:hypothetical protein
MSRRALFGDERADLRGHIDLAIAEIRQVLEIATPVGPMLVGAYRALGTLLELRELVEELPLVEREPDRS